MEKFSVRLSKALEFRRMTAAELSRILGVNEGTISNYKKGNYVPKQRRLEQIATALRVSIPWLMGEDVPMSDTASLPSNALPAYAIPVYGAIPAGYPAFENAEIIDYEYINVSNPEEYFCLRVHGDSMINKGIPDGCTVAIHKQETAYNGQVVACRVNGDEATLKTFTQEKDTVVLMPANPSYQPIIIPVSQFERGDASIYGVVTKIIIACI